MASCVAASTLNGFKGKAIFTQTKTKMFEVFWRILSFLVACALRVPGVWTCARAVARFFSDEPVVGVSDGWAVRTALVLADDDCVGCDRIDDDDDDSSGLSDDDDDGDGDADDHGDDGPRLEPPEREDVTTEFCPATWSGQGWEPFVGNSRRLEIRYAVRRRKFRMVLRRGDTLEWPPYKGVARPAVLGPRGVIAAQLVGFDPTDTVDVTERIKKYAGPHYDFHAGMGYRVRLYDMFPSDSDLDLRFRCLRVLYANLAMRDYDLGLDPIIEHPVVTAPKES
jgi:hypothetical protein